MRLLKLITHNPLVKRLRQLANKPQRLVRIGPCLIGKGQLTFFTAEIGINHNGDLAIAKKLIDVAAEAGCQAVKLQKRTVPMVYSEADLAKPRAVDRAVLENAVKRGALSTEAVKRLTNSDFKESTNGDLKWALEFTDSEYREIFDYAKEKGLLCFASPWDEDSVDFLEKFDPPCYKIASATLTHQRLLRRINQTGRPVILSTGMSTLEEIREAVGLLDKNKLVLLHTISTYPAEEKELNLKMIQILKREFDYLPVGYSGHERGITPTIAAVAVGADVVERHITLDKKMFGSDQAASLEPEELRTLVKEVRLLENYYGDGVKRVLESEIPVRDKLRITTRI